MSRGYAPAPQVHNLTIRAKGKVLLEGTTLTVAAGRRYGLVGPNGKGKSTLLRMVARRQLPVPDALDVLLVEQARAAVPFVRVLRASFGATHARTPGVVAAEQAQGQ